MKLIEQWGYAQCFRISWIGTIWSAIWYRFYCPYPVLNNPRAKACIAAGACGCNNAKPAFASAYRKDEA